MANENGGTGAIFMAFVFGAIAGAAVALLWAPAAGADTRRYLSDKSREAKEKAAEAARQGREFVTRQRQTVSEAVERGREAYQQAKEEKA